MRRFLEGGIYQREAFISLLTFHYILERYRKVNKYSDFELKVVDFVDKKKIEYF